jgi:DNA-directed RNA polymerase specialized sigma24 family protein
MEKELHGWMTRILKNKWKKLINKRKNKRKPKILT